MTESTPAVIRMLNEELAAVKRDPTKVKQVVEDTCKPTLRSLTSRYDAEDANKARKEGEREAHEREYSQIKAFLANHARLPDAKWLAAVAHQKIQDQLFEVHFRNHPKFLEALRINHDQVLAKKESPRDESVADPTENA
jgi:hypothetical protein